MFSRAPLWLSTGLVAPSYGGESYGIREVFAFSAGRNTRHWATEPQKFGWIGRSTLETWAKLTLKREFIEQKNTCTRTKELIQPINAGALPAVTYKNNSQSVI